MDISKLQALMADKKKAMKRTERAAGFKPGKNRIRIAPGWRAGEEHIWFHDFGQHFIKDAADQIQAVYLCTDLTYGKPCAVCGAVKDAIRSAPDDATSEIIAKSVAGKSILVNIFHLDSDTPNTPVVTAVKGKLFTQLMEMLEENGPEAFFDAALGHEIVVTRDGKGLNTTYSATMAIKVGTPIPAAAYKNLTNLDEYVAQESDEQERRAIAAVNSVAGILPAPGTGGDRPMTTATRIAGPATTAHAAPAAAESSSVALDSELDDLLGDLPE
jgi:hypothetical protein